MNKKLIKLLKSQKVCGLVILDTYNQRVVKDVAPTITTRVNASNEIYVAEGEKMTNENEEYIGVYDFKESKTFRPTIEKRIHKNYPTSKTITCRDDSCTVILKGDTSKLRIRKLVPCETLKLMGFERKDEQAMREIGMTDSAIYHCAGDSIITTCLMAIIGQMLPISEEELKQKIEKYVETLKEN